MFLVAEWILSDLADFDHIQLFLESGQQGVVIAPRALGHRAPLLGVWVIAAHQKAGHDAPWWGQSGTAISSESQVEGARSLFLFEAYFKLLVKYLFRDVATT